MIGHSTTEPLDLAIIGGGVAGLAAAVAGHQRGWRVRLLEQAAYPGGKMATIDRDGWLMERGPSSFMSSAAAIWTLIEAAGLQHEVVAAQPPALRFIYRDGKLRSLPSGLGSALFGDWLSFAGKLRVLCEPFIGALAKEDETVAAFTARRLGGAAAANLVGPFVSGVHAGDPAVLGARDAFAKLWRWERDGGSIVRGALKARKAAKASAEGPPQPKRARGMYNLRGGLGALATGIDAWLPEGTIQTGATVVGVTRSATGFELAIEGQQGDTPLRARHLVLAAPASAAARLLSDLQPEAARHLGQVRTCAMAVVHLGGPEGATSVPRGFGVLIRRDSGLRPLGVLLPSSLFPGRAPQGHWLHSVFIGGALDPEAAQLSDDELVALARDAQRQVFGLPEGDAGLPMSFHEVVRWPEAIPQYVVGHRDLVEAALALVERDLPGATLAGSYVDGISIADAAASGLAAVARLAKAGGPS